MTESGQSTAATWLPLTPRGVAAFAYASLGRLWLVQALVASLAAAVGAWFLVANWFPVAANAIERMPEGGTIRDGTLRWTGDTPVRLSENRFLSISVDLDLAGQVRSVSHVQLDFTRSGFRAYSLFGWSEWAYPRGYVIAFNRHELKPWWGAWSPALLAAAVVAVVAGLLLTWTILATVYSVPIWILAFIANRSPGWRGCWRVAGAGLMPGALFMSIVLVVYGLGGLDLLPLLLAGGFHFVIGWLYAAICPFCLPPDPRVAGQRRNPFTSPGSPPADRRQP